MYKSRKPSKRRATRLINDFGLITRRLDEISAATAAAESLFLLLLLLLLLLVLLVVADALTLTPRP